MKNLSLRVLPIIILLLVLGSCNRVYHYYSYSYVLQYDEIEDFQPKVYKRQYTDDIDPYCIELRFSSSRSASFLSESQDRAWYYQQSIENCDTSYNREVGLILDMIYSDNISWSDNLVSINVVSDKDFDSDHPAGTSLNDLIYIRYTSAYKYINNDYDDSFTPEPEEEYLSEIDQNDLKILVYETPRLSFARLSDSRETHTLSITVMLDDGRKFTSDVNYSF